MQNDRFDAIPIPKELNQAVKAGFKISSRPKIWRAIYWTMTCFPWKPTPITAFRDLQERTGRLGICHPLLYRGRICGQPYFYRHHPRSPGRRSASERRIGCTSQSVYLLPGNFRYLRGAASVRRGTASASRRRPRIRLYHRNL